MFVVMTGLPGSGKSTLARQLGPLLGLPVIDKDDILEQLFTVRGIGDSAWRRKLSRESDAIFRERALASGGAILVSFWRLPGMAEDSGTPTEWIRELGGEVIELHCDCPVEVAAQRFCARRRHEGHGDGLREEDEVLESLWRVAGLAALEVGRMVRVETSGKVDLGWVAKNCMGVSALE